MADLDYWGRLECLQIKSLQRRREIQILILVWKLKHNVIPNDVNLEFAQNKRNFKVKAVLKPMPKVKGRLLTSYEQSFIIKSAKLWNTLPSSLTEISDFSLFKIKLNNYVNLIPDKPPVHGYPHMTNNSIKDYKPPNYETEL